MSSVTNGEVYECFKLLNDQGKSKVVAVLEGFKENFELFGNIKKCQYKGVYNKIRSTCDKIKKFNKKKLDTQKLQYLQLDFKLPETVSNLDRAVAAANSTKEASLQKNLHSATHENKNLKRKIEVLEQTNLHSEIEVKALEEKYEKKLNELRDVSSEVLNISKESLKSEEIAKVQFQKLNEKFDAQSAELDKLQNSYSEAKLKFNSSKVRNANKRIKRREEKIRTLEEKVDSLEETVTTLEEEVMRNGSNESVIKDLGEQIRKLQFKASYQKRKLAEKKENCQGNEHETLVKDIETLENKVILLTREKRELEEFVSLLEDEEILTFQDGKYTNEVRETIMELLSLNVSMSKINEVIRIVLKKLANRSVGRLPSMAVQSRLLIEARHLAHVQAAEAMLKNENYSVGNCLHGDGTSKYHRHYQNFQITLKSGKTFSLGLKELAGGDSGTIMKSFNETLIDLSGALFTTSTNITDKQSLIEKLVTSIKCTMSDRGAVNPCFNAQLKTLRETFLPNVVQNWEKLENDVKKSMSQMCNFFCKMHLLPNMASETDKILKVFEDVALLTKESQFSFQSGESGSARLVRTTAKAFHPMGSDEAGVASYFQSFLNGKNEKLRIVSYRGNRFNILFYDAAATYFHRKHIIDFIKSWPNPNNLLKSVEEDISNPVYTAAIRALGIIDKVVTGPYWRVIENKDCILDLNPYLLQMKIHFEKWCKDASCILEGDRLFTDIPVHEDEMYTELFKSFEELDVLTIQCLEMIMHGLLIILERQAEEQLPGGRYFDPGEDIKNISSSVPTSNKVSEKEFASLDLLIHAKPNARVMSYEALIMWTHNKTLDWLESKSEEERELLLESARNNFENVVEKYKERKSELKQKKLEKLLKKQEEKEKSKLRKQTLMVKTTDEMINQGSGVWKTADEVENNMCKLQGDKSKKEALLSQIRFHKHVLKSKGDLKLFSFSTLVNKKRVQHDVVSLKQNLLKIIENNPVETSPVASVNSKVRQANVRKGFFEFEKEKLRTKLLDQRLKNTVNKQKTKLQRYLDNPSGLVGLKFRHKCTSDDGSDWFDGCVLEVKSEAAMKSEFWVRYDDDDEDTRWFFPLLKDLEHGDLIIYD